MEATSVPSGAGAGASAITGTFVLRSVSLFLKTCRKPAANAARPSSSARKKTMPASSYTSTAKLLGLLKKKTSFSCSELESAYQLYKQLTSNGSQQQVGQQSINVGGMRRAQSGQTTEGIDRAIFRKFLHDMFNMITEESLTERIFCYWDRENEGVIRLEGWVLGLDHFLRGSLKEKIAFCFKVYDLNGDGFITKDEIHQLLKNCLIKQPGEEDPDEGVRDLSEMVLKKMDIDRDGKISFADYKAAVTEEPLLLEAFGQCLPTDENSSLFFSKFH